MVDLLLLLVLFGLLVAVPALLAASLAFAVISAVRWLISRLANRATVCEDANPVSGAGRGSPCYGPIPLTGPKPGGARRGYETRAPAGEVCVTDSGRRRRRAVERV